MKMKIKILKLTLILCFFSTITFAQIDSEKNQIDILGNYFQDNVFRFSEIEGAGSVENGNGFIFGIIYNRKISKRIWLSSGINYLKSINDFNPAPTGQPISTIENLQTELLRIPIKVRIDFNKWLYFKTGVTIDSELENKNNNEIDNQSGIGYSLAIGLELKIMKNIYFNIEPELGFTSLIAFDSERYQQHFLITGINFGLGMKF